MHIWEHIKKITKAVVILSMIMIAVSTVLTYMIASSYSFFSGDDYTLWYGVKSCSNGGGLLKGVWGYTVSMYSTWQGVFYSTFVLALLSPLNGLGAMQLRIYMVTTTLLYFGTMFFMTSQFIKNTMKRYNFAYISTLYTLIITSIMGFKMWPEIFYWYSGNGSYMIPLITLYLAIALWLRAIRRQSSGGYVFAMVLFFLSAGGSLEVTGMGCWLALIILIYRIINAKADKKDFMVFLASLTGSLINALAPGNYKRHNVIDSTGLHVGKALWDSFDVANVRLETLLKNNFFWIILLISFLGGVIAGKQLRVRKRNIVVGLLLFLSPYVVIFPVILGYSDINIPNRCDFILYNVISIMGVLAFFYAGVYFHKVLLNRFKYVQAGVIAVGICIIIKMAGSCYIPNLMVVQTMTQLINNEIQTYTARCRELYDSIGQSEDEIVLISQEDIPDVLPGYRRFTLSEDENSWINQCIAFYYGKQYAKVVNGDS